MIRVLNIISDSNIGGAGRVILNYLRYADRDRFETWVAVPVGSALTTPLEQAGARVLPVVGMAERSYHRQDVQTLVDLIRREGPDLVHTHGALSGRIAARRCGKKVVYTRHSVFPVSAKLRYPTGRWLNRWVNLRYADQIIAVSPAAAENLVDAGVPAGRIRVILNGVAPVARSGPEACRALREQYGLSEGVFTAGILARLEPYKGHQHILEAARQLKEEGRRLQILVAGTGGEEGRLRAQAAQMGLEDTVFFLGFQSDVAPVLSLLDVQLNASYGTEATSLALLEGMSLGLPTIASSYGGNPWIVEDGVSGLISPSRDSGALAGAIAQLMDQPDTRAQLGRQAREQFLARFTGQGFARNVEQVYLDVLKGDNHGTE